MPCPQLLLSEPNGCPGTSRLGRALLRCGTRAALVLSAAFLQAQAPFPANLTVRIGFSARSLATSNHADVAAAMKAWLLTVARERHLAITADPAVFDSFPELENALGQERLDVVNAPTDEFIALEKIAPLVKVFASLINGRSTEQYVLLVNKDQPFQDLKDLKGASLVILDHPRAALAPLWLDVELLHHRLPVAARLFAKVTLAPKPALAILAVFFKQAGAALVTRASFDLANELNPQLARNLRVLALSPELVPTVGAFRANAVHGAVELYRREALRINETQGGKLFLNLFQTDGVVELKEADLAGTRALVAEYARLRPAGGTPQPRSGN